jgi:hypothetical protein
MGLSRWCSDQAHDIPPDRLGDAVGVLIELAGTQQEDNLDD